MEQKDPRTYAVIGAAMEVHRELGPGFLEAVYREALALEMQARSIPYAVEVELPVFYKGTRLAAAYRTDMIAQDSIVVELKAIPKLGNAEEAQMLNYLKATGLKIGLLLNFGGRSLE
jgi:GxxExxY protein